MTSPQEGFVLYNLGPPDERAQPNVSAPNEVRALLHDEPMVGGFVEAIGYAMPKVPGYTLIRDVTKASRANVAAYVRSDVNLSSIHWWDMRQEWPRTEHPGMHPPRSWVEFRAEGMQVIVGHQPPKMPPKAGGVNATLRCQGEGIRFLTERLAPWTRAGWLLRPRTRRDTAKERPRIVLADWNRNMGEQGPGPSQLADRIDGKVIGPRIDAGVGRQLVTTWFDYPEVVNGVRLLSDHHHAFRCKVVFK